MGTKRATVKRTRMQLCAEPDCPIEVGPRNPTSAFLVLHCDEHKYNHSATVREGQPWSSKWARHTCEACGCLYERYATAEANNASGRYFCTMACRSTTGSKPRRGVMRTCAECGEEFYVRASSAAKYCSRPCKDIGSRTAVYLDFTCKNCGVDFQVAESQARWNTNEFCTRQCRSTYSKYKPGDKKLSGDGYVMVLAPDHPMAQPSTGWVFEHRMVISDIIGRPLKPSEEVHHRSGLRDVNTPDQLVLMSKSHPAGAGLRDTLDWCYEFIAENEPLAQKLEAAGVHTTLDNDDAVVPLLGEDT